LFFLLLESGVLAASCSLDAFAAAFAYGCNRVRISFLQVQIINIVCKIFLGCALFLGAKARAWMTPGLAAWICFGILLALGAYKLYDSIRNRCAGETIKEKTISPWQAAALAVSLSLDGLAVGFGAGLGGVNAWATLAFALITDTAAVVMGCSLGLNLARKMRVNLAWLGGVVLIGLAILKIV